MSDIDGEDAFERVLDRLVDAEHRVCRADASKHETEARLRSVGEEAERLQRRALEMADGDKCRERERAPRLEQLWKAADAVRDFVFEASAHGQALTDDSDLMKTLRKALDEAGPWCGQPPF